MSIVVEKELPKGWILEKLSVITNKIGDGLHSTPVYTNHSDFHFINGNNLRNGKIAIDEKTKCVNKIEFEKYRIDLSLQTVLLSINGTIGNLAIYNNEKVILGKSACYINCKEILIVKYLYFLLQSPQIIIYFKGELTQTTISNLSLKSIRNTIIPCPPLNEQKRIVAKIEELFSLVDSAKETLEKTQVLLKQYRQSILKQIFHSKSQQYNLKEIEMNKIFTNRHGDSLPKTKIKQGSYPVFGGNGVVGFHNENNVDGDVIIVGRVGAQCGNIHFNSGQCWITDNTIGLIPKTEINIKFFFYQFKNLELKNISAGSGQPYISGKRLSELNILLTDINEQNKIVEKIEESFSLIEKNEILIDQLLLQYKQIKNSILKQAFEGKLVPQDPNDEPAEVLLQRIREEKNGK